MVLQRPRVLLHDRREGVGSNPFSDVCTLEMSSSEEEDLASNADADAEDDDTGASSVEDESHSDAPLSQILVPAHFPSRGQRIRLLATFRLPPLYTQAADEDPRGPCPAHAGAEEQALQVLRPTTTSGIMVAETGTTATVVHRFHTRGNPALVVLDKETDLTASPLPVCVGAGGALSPSCRTQRQITAGAADNDAAVMNDALATLAGVGPEAIDFVSSSQTMKTIFSLMSSTASVTVAVHRVDRSLVLNGIIKEQARPGEGDRDTSASDARVCGQKKLSQREKRNRKKRPDTNATQGAAQTDQMSSLYSKFMYYSASPSDDPAEPALEKDVAEGLTQERVADATLADTPAAQHVQGAPKTMHGVVDVHGDGQVFRRAVHFQFHDLNLLLGSDTVIFNHGAQPSELSLRLLDADSEVPKMTCLDYWLDNIFNQVSQTAVCYHKEGKVHGYQLVRTQDLPAWRGLAFEPKAVMESASSILHFLQTHCTQEAGTYWLYRPEGADEIQLYCLDDADNRERSALSQPVGLLCFKIARRLQLQDREACAAGGSCKQRQRTARLFCNAIAVLNEVVHPTVVALSHEGLADAMVGAEWAAPKSGKNEGGRGGGDGAGAEAEREAEFYVDENGDLQDAVKPVAGDEDEDTTARPSVGDTVQWGAAYSLADLENAEAHYLEAAGVRGLSLTADDSSAAGPGLFGASGVRPQAAPATERDALEHDDMRAIVSRRLRCKAAKCAIAIGLRLLRKKGAVADALIKAVNAYGRCVGGRSREEQEVVSEAMELWADVHVALAALTRVQVLSVRDDIRKIQEQERFLSSGVFGSSDLSGEGHNATSLSEKEAALRDMTPLSHPLSPDVEDNCNHAIRYLIRSLQCCNASGRRTDLTTKLASVYSQLGAHYITMGRFTRAHQHFQQGTQLFQSIGDEQSAAKLTFNLGRLFAARAHAAPITPGLSPEQLSDLVKGRTLVQQAHQTLAALVASEESRVEAGAVHSARAHKVLKELVSQVHEELADIHMAIGVGKLHEPGSVRGVAHTGKLGCSVLVAGTGGGVVGGPASAVDGEDFSENVEEEAADKSLHRALAIYERLNQQSLMLAAHVHFALFTSRVESEAAAMNRSVGGVGGGGGAGGVMSEEVKAAKQRTAKAWRQRSERHLEQAAALATTLCEHVRVQCIRGELAGKRGSLSGLIAALDALLQLPMLRVGKAGKQNVAVSPARGEGWGAGAHLCDANTGVRGAGAGGLARWAPFDGGWGANIGNGSGEGSSPGPDGGNEEEAIWHGVQKQTMALLMMLVRLLASRKGAAQQADRYKSLFRTALELSQQHAGKELMQLLAAHHAESAKIVKTADVAEDGDDAEARAN